MRLILLPGLDGTGALFSPLIEKLPNDIRIQIISYPLHRKLNYAQLENYVRSRLPVEEEYVLIAESFSGVIAYNIAKNVQKNLKSIIFVAGFLQAPLPYLSLTRFLPLSILFKLSVPEVILKYFLLGNEVSGQIADLFRNTVNKVSANVLAYRVGEIARLPEVFGKLDITCAYIQATEDKLVPKNNINYFRKVFSRIKVIPLQGPHFILQAKPIQCSKVIVEEYRRATIHVS